MRRFSPLLLALALMGAQSKGLPAQLTITPRAASISVGGLMHTQYSRSSADGENGGTDAVDDVLVRRARILLDMRVGDLLDARIEPDFGGTGPGVGLADMYARVTLARAFRLSAGQFKRAFSIFELASDTDLPDIERDARIEGVGGCPGVGGVCSFSRLAQRLQFDERDLGVRAEGDIGSMVQYVATFTNGEGRGAADVNDSKSLSGRVTVALTPNLKLAGYAGQHDYLAGTVTRYAEAFGGDLEVGTWRRGLHVLAGFIGGDNWMSGTDAAFTSGQLLGSLYVPFAEGSRFAGIEPMLRVDRSSTESATGAELNALILTPGVSLYLDGKNWLGVNLDHYDPSTGDSAWSLKTQLFFYY